MQLLLILSPRGCPSAPGYFLSVLVGGHGAHLAPTCCCKPSPAEAQPTATPQSTELLSKPHVPNIHLTQSYISIVPELFFSQTDQCCYKSPQDAEARQDVTFMCSAFCLPRENVCDMPTFLFPLCLPWCVGA